MEILNCYIGWDARENAAYEVCRHSIVRRSSEAVHIVPLRVKALRHIGLYRRAPDEDSRIDSFDGKPYSTDFSFTRFLVPAMMQYDGWALFCDCDFLFQDDIAKLFACRDDEKAVMVVKHDYRPREGVKMDGVKQEVYPRKNWSSLMLFNCSHPSNKRLTVDAVSIEAGSFLHGLGWLKDDEIGALPHRWNALEGGGCRQCEDLTHYGAIHYTRGGPWFRHKPPEGMGLASWNDVGHADLWLAEQNHMRPTRMTA